MTCKLLTSNWLTALSITVIKAIQLTERHTEKGRMRARQREGEGDREKERERERERDHWVFWLIEYRKKSCLGASRPGDRAPILLIGAWWLDTIRLPVHGSRGAPRQLFESAPLEPGAQSGLSVFNCRAPDAVPNQTISSSTFVSWPIDATLICYSHK